jgi:hypothetical protein
MRQETVNPDDLIARAEILHGPRYTELLKADMEIAQRQRDNPPVPEAWKAKRRRMGRRLDSDRVEFERERERMRREFWRGSDN